MNDNLLAANQRLRSNLVGLKRKLTTIKVSLELLDSEIDRVDVAFCKLERESEIYKAKLEREMGREVRQLKIELNDLKKLTQTQDAISPEEFKIASTIGIFQTILRGICENADDFRLISEAFLFPAVFERVVTGEDEAYLLDKVPDSAAIVIARGKEYVEWFRSEYTTHLTDPEVWQEAIDYSTEWWRNDALPVIYGAHDPQWDIDMPLSLAEMTLWRTSPADRPIHFASVFDALEIYKRNKDAIYTSSGIRSLELTFLSSNS